MPPAIASSSIPLQPLTSELASAAEERAFRRWDFPEHARRVRASVGVGSTLLVAFAYADYLFFGTDRRFAALVISRLACAALGALVIASARDGDRIARHDRLLQAWTGGVAVIAVVAAATRPVDYQLHGVVMVVVVLAFYLIVPNRFAYALGLGCGVSLAYAAVVVGGARPAHLYVAVLFLTILLSNCFGALGCQWLHRLRRTEYRRLEREEATQQLLRSELEERARTERRLVEADRAKSLFFATMSHEIRTPLHGMMSCAHLLSGSTLSGEQREHVELIRYSGKGMIQLLDEILDISRAEAGTLRLLPVDVDLRRMVREISSFVRPRVRAAGLSFEVAVGAPVPDVVRGDASRLRQVLLNLLENAVKFTERGTISLSVTAIEVSASAATLRFAVTDDGPGVPAEARAAIFEPFVQGPLPQKPTSGSGLGLAICKRIVEAMGGTIGVDDAPGAGSRFHFTVTLGIGVAGAPREATSPALPELPALSLLVVEDDEVSRRLATMLLAREGHEVTLATSGLEAVALVRERSFDAVLMDIRLPGIDGCTATERIRALPDAARARIPVIATTASVMAGEEARYRAAGISRVLAKPVEHGELVKALVAAIEGRPSTDAKLPPRESRAEWIDEALLSRHAAVLGRDAMEGLLDLFLQISDASMAGLAAAVRSEDAARVAHEAHRLASAAESAGARRCAAEAARLEVAARTETGAIPAAFAALERAYDRSSVELRARLSRRAQPISAPMR